MSSDERPRTPATRRRVHVPAQVPTPLIGPRLRATRMERSLTLDQVAEATGLTKSFLSKLERDAVSPSVASLVAVCHALGLPVGRLFEPAVTAHVPAGTGALINFGGTDVVERLLTPGDQQALQVIHSVIAPGGHGGQELYTLPSEVEFVFVVRGTLAVEFADHGIRLAPGDALTFDGREPHTWRNGSGAHECEVVWALTPAP